MRRLLPGAVAALVLLLPGTAFGQATRTWVSGVGDDVNPCSRTAPCKTWAGAISKTAIAGEINALDPGGFGTLTITKSITVDGGDAFASTLASGVSGFLINVPTTNVNDPQQRVVLRNLAINGTGTSGGVGTNTGVSGVRIDSARDVRIENTRIFNFTQNGIDLTPSATSPPATSLLLDGVRIADVGRNGLEAASATGQSLSVMVRDSTITGTTGATPGSPVAANTGAAVAADTGAHIWLTGTTIFDNLVGLRAQSTTGAPGIIDGFCDNQLAGNGTDGSFTNSFCQNPPPPTVITNTNTVTTPAPPPVTVTVTKEVTTPARCVVPKLTGLTVAAARTRLKGARCALGTVTRRKAARRSQVGRVTAQRPAPKKTLAVGSKVAVTVGRA